MIRLKVSGGNFDPLIAMVGRMARPDLSPLAESIRDVMIADNRDGLLAGTDSFGDRMDDVEESTIRRGRGGFGPPTIPRFSASQLIDRFRVTIDPTSDGGFSIKGNWPGVPQVEFFRTGTVHMAARNPIGIRPDTRARIQQAIDEFASGLIGGRSRFGPTSGFGT